MAIKTLDDLRSEYPELEGQPDDVVIDQYSREKNISRAVLDRYFGTSKPVEQVATSEPSDTARALSTYAAQMKGLGAGVGALAADVVGADKTRDELFKYYQSQMATMQDQQRPQYELEYLTSEEAGLGDYVDAAQYYGTLGLANIAGGGLAGFVGKQVARQGLKRAVKEASEKQLKRAGDIGFYGGIGAQAIGQEVGATYGQAGEERIAEGGTLEDVDKARAVAFGTAAGALEFAGDVVLLGAGKFLPVGTAEGVTDFITSGGKIRRALTGGTVAAGVEGATEIGQTILEDIGAESEVDLGDDQYRAKLAQAAFAGAAAGGIAGGTVAGVFGGRNRQEDDFDDLLDTDVEADPIASQAPKFRTLQEGINASLGIDQTQPLEGAERRQYEKDLAAALDEPSGEIGIDVETQQEVELSVGDLLERQAARLGVTEEEVAIQTPLFRSLQEGINASLGIDQEQLTDKERAKLQRELAATYNQGSGVFIADPETQQEIELSVGELLELEAVRRAPLPELTVEEKSQLPILYQNPDPFVMVATPDGVVTRQAIDPNTSQYEELLDEAIALLYRRGGQQVQSIETVAPDSPVTPAEQAAEQALDRAVESIDRRVEQGQKEDAKREAKNRELAQEQQLLNDPIYQTEGGQNALQSQKTSRGTPNRTLQMAVENYRKATVASLRKSLNNPKISDWKKALINEILVEKGQRAEVAGQPVATTQEIVQEQEVTTPSEVQQESARQELAEQGESAVASTSQVESTLNETEQQVWNVLTEAFANDDAESIISLRGGKRTSGLSPTRIAAKMGLDPKSGRKKVDKALNGLRSKIQSELGVDMQSALAELNRRNRSVIEDSVLPESGTEVSQEELVEGGGLTVRSTDKGESQIGMMEPADAKRIDQLLALPAVDSVMKEQYEADTGKSWDALPKAKRRAWFSKFEAQQEEAQAELEAKQEAQRIAESQARNHRRLIEAFTAEPRFQQVIDFYNQKVAPNSQEPAARVPFEEMSTGYQQVFIEAVVDAGRVPQKIRSALANVRRAIEEDVQNEQRSNQKVIGQARSVDTGATEGVAQISDQRPEGVLELSSEQQETARKTAEELAANGKIKVKRRVSKGTKDSMAHENAEGGKPQNPVSRGVVEAVVNRIRNSKRWVENGWKIVVVDTFEQLPQSIKDENDPNTLMGVQSYLYDDKNEIVRDEDGAPILAAYIITDMHTSDVEVENTVLHEVIGHVAQMLNSGNKNAKFSDLASAVFSMSESDFMEMAERFGVADTLRHYEATYRADGYAYAATRQMLFEEMIAHVIGDKKNTGIRNAVKRIVGQAKQALRRMGMFKLSALSDGEILALMHSAEKTLQGVSSGSRIAVPVQGPIRMANALELEAQDYDVKLLEENSQVNIDDVIDKSVNYPGLEDLYFDVITDAMVSDRYELTPSGRLAPKESNWNSKLPRSMAKLRRDGETRKEADRSMIHRMASAVSNTLEEYAPGVPHAAEKMKLGWLTLEQILRATNLDQVRNYITAVHKIQRVSKDMLAEAHTVNKVWASLQSKKPAQIERLHDVMIESTMAEYDPTMDRAITAEQRKIKRDFDALDQDVQDLYVTVRDEYSNRYAMKVDILQDAILKAEAADNGRKLNDLRGKLETMRKIKGPYFPLKRLGKFYAVGMSNELSALMQKNDEAPLVGAEKARMQALRKDPKHYRVESFSNIKQARDRARQLIASMGDGYHNEASEYFELQAKQIPDIQKIESYFINSDLSDAAKGKVRGILAYMYADMLPDGAAAKQQMRREGIAGADRDMRQVFADSSVKDAHQISRMLHAPEVNQAMVDLNKLGSRGDTSARNVANELVQRANLMYEHQESPLVDSLMTLSYFAHLGMSPAYIMTNMSQVPMITVPFLRGRHSTGDVLDQTYKGLEDAFKVITSNFSQDGWRMEFNWEGKLNKGESAMMQELLERNKLDVTIEHDLTTVAKGANSSGAVGLFSRNNEGLQLLNTPVRLTELANRGGTALAAYRLEAARLKRGQAKNKLSDKQIHERATSYAVDAVDQTQLDYSGLNAARYMQSLAGSKQLAKLAFQFRKYQQGMLALVFSNIKKAMVGATRQQRVEARRTLVGLFTTTALMGGTVGLPLAGTIAAVVNLAMDALGDEDEPYDVEVELRNALTDYFDADIATAIVRGLPAMIGADVSKRVGMGDLLFPVPYARKGDNLRDSIGEYLVASLGAGPTYALSAGSAAFEYVPEGEYLKALEKIVPLKVVQNVLKAFRYSEQGMTDRQGEPILQAEQFDAQDLIIRAMGFSTRMESDYYEAYGRMRDIEQALSETRSNLIREYAQARLGGDSRRMSQVLTEIKEFNDRNKGRGRGVVITKSSLIRSTKTRAQNRAERLESGVRGGRRYQPYLEDVRFATGE